MIRHICFFALTVYAIFLQGQDSLNMERIGQWNPSGMPSTSGVIFNDIWGFAIGANEYAIIGNVDSVLIVDVSDPTQPDRTYGYYGGDRSIWRDFKTHNGFLYAVCDACDEGLHVFDMNALPAGDVIHVLNTTSFFESAHNIFIDTTSQRLYVAGSDTASEGLIVLDISNPSSPVLMDNIIFDVLLGQPSANFYVHDVYVRNDTAYCSHGNRGFFVWDMTDLNNVTLLGDYNSPGYNHSSWLNDAGTHAYYAEEIPLGRPLAAVDLANLGDPIQDIQVVKLFKDPISNVANNPTPHNPFVKMDTMYLSYYEDGLKVYDLSVPHDPQLIGFYDTYGDNGTVYTGYEGAWGAYPFLPSGNILISDITYGLNVIKTQSCTSPVTYYADRDGDGYGDANNSVVSCSVPGTFVLDATDCDDENELIYPEANEICDDLDNDCDGLIDADDPEIIYDLYYEDADNDGYGNALVSISACELPHGFVVDNTDCDDTNNMVNPGFPEICDGIDNDCDNLVDNDDVDLTSIEWQLDSDGDGFGDGSNVLFQCTQPDNYTAFGGDCNDNNNTIYPNAPEICDGLDNDCDFETDEACLYLCDGINVYVPLVTKSNYYGKVSILSDAQISSGQNIYFQAGEEIILDNQFEVPSNATFTIDFGDCID